MIVSKLLRSAMVVTASDEPRITVRGTVFDAAGEFIPDAMLESWQADRKAFGRFAVDSLDVSFGFETVAPRSIRTPGAPMKATHLCVGVFARGLLKRLYTRRRPFAGDRPDPGPGPPRVPLDADRSSDR
jgi:protocatechuate 3,4-dioxygenase alpha subunit